MSSSFKILACDDDLGQLELTRDLLVDEGHRMVLLRDPTKVFDTVIQEKPDLILLDIKMPIMSGFEVCQLLKADERTHDIPVIFITATFKDIRDKVFGLDLGADDYVTKPYDIDEMLARVNAVLRVLTLRRKLIAEERENASLKREVDELNQRLAEHSELPKLVVYSPSMQQVVKQAKAAAQASAHVLITGESGTGKSVAAAMIQRLSSRAQSPFVKVDCSALTGSLLEKELFGAEGGTGALKTREGCFERAHGGTILLDEIGELPLELHPKLLRVVRDRELERVGGDRTLKLDVRVIATTRSNLPNAVEEGRFLRELHDQLNALSIPMPPLRERTEDIAPLAGQCLGRFASRNQKPAKSLDQAAMERLRLHSWPGNVRELERVVEQAVILTGSETISGDAIVFDAGVTSGS